LGQNGYGFMVVMMNDDDDDGYDTWDDDVDDAVSDF